MQLWNANDDDYPLCNNKTNAKFTAWYKCIIAYYSCCEPGRHWDFMQKHSFFTICYRLNNIYMFVEREEQIHYTRQITTFSKGIAHTHSSYKNNVTYHNICTSSKRIRTLTSLRYHSINHNISSGTVQFRLGSFNWNFLKRIDSVFNHLNLICFLFFIFY